MFMDVSLPVSQLTHPQLDESSANAADPANSDDRQSGNAPNDEDPYSGYKKPSTILTVAIFHTPEIGRIHKFGGNLSGDSDDMFLGAASIDLTRLFTGKISTLDKWLTLHGTSADSKGSVRIVCEYEPSDAPPKPGDICRFTRFCHPKDLYPLEPGRAYSVEKVQNGGDIVLLSYESQEGWVLSFQAHKNMLICEERHVSVLDTAQDELQTFGERLAYSPLVANVTQTAERVVDDGIVGVAEEIAKGGISLLDRWLKGGIDTVVSDLQNVTNIDGRHNPTTGESLELSSPMSSAGSLPADPNEDDVETAYLVEEEEEEEALPNMPPCPITGFPMKEPVVAADGHTYERSAIARWLRTSDKSPMTGAVLVHKELVPNYGLMTSVEEAAARERKAALAAKKSALSAASMSSGNSESPPCAKKPPPSEEIEDGEEEAHTVQDTPLKSEK